MKNFIIAQEPDFTIQNYVDACTRKEYSDKVLISDAIKRRLIQRYIKPGEVEGNKNGFNIMPTVVC